MNKKQLEILLAAAFAAGMQVAPKDIEADIEEDGSVQFFIKGLRYAAELRKKGEEYIVVVP